MFLSAFFTGKDGNVAQELHQVCSSYSGRYLFEKSFANFDFFSKLRTAVYPPNMARIGAKLWQNAFQTICKFSFFDAEFFFSEKKIGQKFRGRVFFKKVRFWRSYEFLIRVGRCVVKSYCPNCPYFWGDFLGEGVKEAVCSFEMVLGPKMTSTLLRFFFMVWYDDLVT